MNLLHCVWLFTSIDDRVWPSVVMHNNFCHYLGKQYLYEFDSNNVINVVLDDRFGNDRCKGKRKDQRSNDREKDRVESSSSSRGGRAAGKRRDDPKKIRGRCKEEVAGTSGIKKFQEEFGEGEVAGSEVEDAWGELKRRIKGAMKE